jgi:hypothetical protein
MERGGPGRAGPGQARERSERGVGGSSGESDYLKELMSINQQLMNAVEKLQGQGTSSSAQDNGSVSANTQGSSSRAPLWNPMNILTGKRRRGDPNIASRHPLKKPKSKASTWTHTFVCLAYKDQDFVPESNERAALHLAGLGEKKITFSTDANANTIHLELLEHFPKLSSGKGYELLRLERGQKLLLVINRPPCGYTVPYLQTVAHNAKIYVRPIQHNLSIEVENAAESLNDSQTEECIYCEQKIFVTCLREHIEKCETRHFVDDYSAVDIPEFVGNSPISSTASLDDFETTEPPDNSLNEVQPSNKDNIASSPTNHDEIKTIDDLAKYLEKMVHHDAEFDLIIRRSNVVEDALRAINKALFDPRKLLNVEFIGEFGTDAGGLKREFFSIFKHGMSAYMEETGCFKHNSVAYKENVYRRLGMIAGLCLSQGGWSFNVLALSVFKVICGVSPSDITPSIEEVNDATIKNFLEQVNNCFDVSDLRDLGTNKIELLYNSGFQKSPSLLDLSDKQTICQTVALNCVILSALAELMQFREGLHSVPGMKMALEHHPHLLEAFYCINHQMTLTAGKFAQ